MVEIILEHTEGGHHWIDYPDDFNRVLVNGKTVIKTIEDDIASNIDSSGWCKYREVLKELNIITSSDVNKWNIEPSIGIPDSTKKVLISLNPGP